MPKTLTEKHASDLAEMHFYLAQEYRSIAHEYGAHDTRHSMLMRKAGDIDDIGMAWLESYKHERIAA